jgi:hypothetical protein
MSINKIQEAPLKQIKSLGWLNQTLPNMVCHPEWEQLLRDSSRPVESFSVCGPFLIDGENNKLSTEDYYVKHHKVPTIFPKVASNNVGKPVNIENDAVAWTKGLLRWHELTGKEKPFPLLTLSLGTGIGMAIAHSDQKVLDYVLTDRLSGRHFPRLTEVANYGGRNSTSGKVHDILGFGFFSWIRDKRKTWDLQKIKYEYTKRFLALLYDLRYSTPFVFSKVSTIGLCGGSLQYLSREMLLDSQKDHLKSKTFLFIDEETIDLNPDKIPLIGNLQNPHNNS